MRLLLTLCALICAGVASAQDSGLAGRASIIDADTLDIHGQRIRLFGVDAPEKGQTCVDSQKQEWRCGQRAALLVADFIGARPVVCQPRDTDRYGRIIAKCTVSNIDIGEWLVSNGLAVAYRRYASDYIGVEQSARNRKAGVWSGEFVMPEDYRHHRRGGYSNE